SDPSGERRHVPTHQDLEGEQRPGVRAEKKRITKLYAKAPPNSKVICVDEFGPVEVRPIHGHSWQQAGHPSRIRATYNRKHGVRHYISSYDLAANRLVMRCYRRKRWQEFLSFLKTLRRRHAKHLRRAPLLLSGPTQKIEGEQPTDVSVRELGRSDVDLSLADCPTESERRLVQIADRR